MAVETRGFRNVEEIIEDVLSSGRGIVPPDKVMDIIRSCGISTPSYILAKTLNEVLNASRAIGFPVVLKIVSPDLLHKTDVGGVALGLRSEEEVEKSYNGIMHKLANDVPDACITGMLVQKHVRQATEVIIGGIRDEQFGPTVMFGLGGIFVEVFKDVVFRIAPVTETEALEMIMEIKGYPILSGYRGMKALDIPHITRTIISISEIISNIEEIKEVELNPLFVYEKGTIAVDARIILGKSKKGTSIHE